MSEVKDLKTTFVEKIIPELKKTLGVKNSMAVPKVSKVTINAGIGSILTRQGNKDYNYIFENIGKISGQKAVVTKAKKAISNFKLKEQTPVGISVTLRGKKMYDFLNKLINIVFPRVRDFRGLSPKSFDGNGNYCIGFREHIVFPEINPEEISKLHGLQINISTTAQTNEQAMELLKAMGFPFRK